MSVANISSNRSNTFSSITSRQEEVLQLIASEYTTGEIAQQLFLSIETIRSHRKDLLGSLQVRNTAGLIRRAFELGILKTSQ